MEPLAIAKLLRSLAEREKPDLVILGKQAIDDDCNQTGQMLAALLDWPQGTSASGLSLAGDGMDVRREVDRGIEILAMPLPAIATTDLRLNMPRYAPLPNIMRAKKKPLALLTVEELAVDITPRLAIVETAEPAGRKRGLTLASADELVDRLRNEARVITKDPNGNITWTVPEGGNGPNYSGM